MQSAPNSTRIIGVPSGQAQITEEFIKRKLQEYQINGQSLLEALRQKNIRIKIVALAIHALSFEFMLCGGQYGL